jgi:hypothetical protein
LTSFGVLGSGVLPDTTGDSSSIHPPQVKRFGLLIAIVLAANLISAAFFTIRVNRPVYDDSYNLVDVHLYATRGVSVASVKSQANPPGPVGFVWMAAGVKLLGGEELRDARIASLTCWVLLVAGVLFGARYSRFPELWRDALLCASVFPHAVESTALVLTEGPALLFATLGALAWIESVTADEVTPASATVCILGGFAMGLSVVCRQYYLALVPAAGLLALVQSRARHRKGNLLWWASVVTSLIASAAPVLLLLAIWKGLTSPGVATGTSNKMWHAQVGINYVRPIISGFYVVFYLLLLAFPASFGLKRTLRLKALAVACAGGLVAGYLQASLLQPGPLRTAIYFVARQPAERFILFGLLTAMALYNAIALGSFGWARRAEVSACPPLVFALVMISFFVAEQFGVGGNMLLYERYTLQLAPFLGLVSFALFPRLSYPRLCLLVAMSEVSHIMLWRYAFGG